MNSVNRRKLGLAQNEAKKEILISETKISENTPISLSTGIKDYGAYSKLNIKSFNTGTLRNPSETLALFNEETQSYTPIQLLNPSVTSYYFSKQDFQILLNGQVLNYKTNQDIDQNNPYDPLFASFDRLYSLPIRITKVSGVTGINYGEKEKFSILSTSFGKSSNLLVKNAGSNLNGVFVPSGDFNGKTRYVNASVPAPAEIIYVSSTLGSRPVLTVGTGWMIRQQNFPLSFVPPSTSRGWTPMYLNANTGITIPTGNNWATSGSNWRISSEGQAPLPSVSNLETEGFFKLGVRRVDGKKIIATGIGSTGLMVGSTTGNLPPQGASFVTYPHSYNVESFPAFRYPLSITFAESTTGIHDILVISTGIQSKNIVYVSPHFVTEFVGFWSQESGSSRTPLTGVGGNVLSSRSIFALGSGNLITVTSENLSITGLNSYQISGISGISGAVTSYNFESAVLKQSTPLVGTLFYKMYEPLYKQNTFNTGVWDGVIPSGVPFTIETVRTKNENLHTPKLEIYIRNAFVNISPSGSGQYQSIKTFNSGDFDGHGVFEGMVIDKNSTSVLEAKYQAVLNSKKQAKSKLYGYLWEKGLTVDNSKVKKIIKLFGNTVTSSGIVNGKKYCLPYDNPSDPRSCSYTGAQVGIRGIQTSYGIRIVDQGSNFIPNLTDEDGNLIKFIQITEE